MNRPGNMPERRKAGSRRNNDERWQIWDRRVRDLGVWLLGIGLTINELVIRDGELRPLALMLITTLLGLPFVYRADDARRAKNGR